jgi:hypothetical protein
MVAYVYDAQFPRSIATGGSPAGEKAREQQAAQQQPNWKAFEIDVVTTFSSLSFPELSQPIQKLARDLPIGEYVENEQY